MPFESLPGNTHIQLPNIPWQAAQVGPHDLEPRDPGLGLRTLEKAMDSINESIKGLSPLERAKKQMQMQQLKFQQNNFMGYQQNPENYTLTANGPIPKSHYQVMSEALHLSKLGQDVQQETIRTNNAKKEQNFFGVLDSLYNAKGDQTPDTPPTVPDMTPSEPIKVPDPMGNSNVSLQSDEDVNLYGN